MPTNEDVELATYVLKAGGHCDNYGPDDGEGNPGNLTGEVDHKETVVIDGKQTVVTTKKSAPMRHLTTTNERNPAVFKSPQLDLHKRFPHKYQRVDEKASMFSTSQDKPEISVKPKNDMLDNMTKPQLLNMAAEQEIDVEGITNKTDLIKAIRDASNS